MPGPWPGFFLFWSIPTGIASSDATVPSIGCERDSTSDALERILMTSGIRVSGSHTGRGP